MQPRLTRHAVLAAALELVDRDGLPALSMRRLGRELGVEAMSLYNHVRDKEDLLDGIVELLASLVDVPGPETGDWADRIAELVRRYRALARRHPNAFPLIAVRPLRTPEARRPVEQAFALAIEAGLDRGTARVMFRVLASYASGFALNELAGGFTDVPGADGDDVDADFERGLGIIVEAFRGQLPRGRRPRAAATPPSPSRRTRGR